MKKVLLVLGLVLKQLKWLHWLKNFKNMLLILKQ